MTLREDNSLGFYMMAPDSGLAIYGGVGTFYNDIEMSSGGLRGYGSFDFLNSSASGYCSSVAKCMSRAAASTAFIL